MNLTINMAKVNRVIQATAIEYGVTIKELLSNSRKPNILEARRMAMLICNRFFGVYISEIAHRFNRNHSTIVHDIKRAEFDCEQFEYAKRSRLAIESAALHNSALRAPFKVLFKALDEDAVIPTKATPGSAAYDIVVPKDTRIHQGRQVIPLLFAIELPPGYEAKIEPRSGYSSKGFVGTIADTEYRFDADVINGKIDSDYRGGVGVIVHSREQRCFVAKAGQRIAQMTIYKVEEVNFEEVDELSDSERNDGGFGHSGN